MRVSQDPKPESTAKKILVPLVAGLVGVLVLLALGGMILFGVVMFTCSK